MAKYMNPNRHVVTIDMGNPTRVQARVMPHGQPPKPGHCSVVEMDPAKATQYVHMGMLRAHPDQAAKADLDMPKLEAEAADSEERRAAGLTRRPETADEAAARKAKDDAFRAQEAAALAAEAARVAKLAEVKGRIRNTLAGAQAVPVPEVVRMVMQQTGLGEAAAARLVDEAQGELDAGATADQSGAGDGDQARDALAQFKKPQPKK